MPESLQAPTIKETLWQRYLELTRKQTDSYNWTKEDREELLELKELFEIDQPELTREQKEALHRQGKADTPLKTGGEPQPPLTVEERRLIMEIKVKH